ncbi:Signal peptidase [Geoglobus acetivorans]|uniref:Signal peptidase n=1 Tax=Geoglobus acetivorans TaxID=565033 RepID=A0A0A7GJS4_GEOAI|nr:Signal peptidase [Geoglobus acetivorans]
MFSYAISESMEPTIGVGDLFLINPLSKGDAGSIIVFQMGDMYVVHRVYAIEGDAYITKGDNNIATDQQNGKNPPISTDKVVGEVVSFGGRPILVPGAGKLVEALHSNSLFLAALLISLGFLSLGKNKKTKKEQKENQNLCRAVLWYRLVSPYTLAHSIHDAFMGDTFLQLCLYFSRRAERGVVSARFRI